jgi:two-component system NarL family sensor kinase
MHSEETRIYVAILTAALILVILIGSLIATIVKYQRKKIMLHRERINAEIISLEKEKERIASDLHDDLGASLSAIKLRLEYLDPSDAKEALLIRESSSYIDEAMRKLRYISFNMVPQVLKRKGLREALYELIEVLKPKTTIKINYNYSAKAVLKEKEIHIYRITQEIMNNILKHSNATVVNFSVTSTDKKIVLHIQDNGMGFDKNEVSKKRQGLGLQNIMARADLLKAKIYLTTEPKKGADFLIEIPS